MEMSPIETTTVAPVAASMKAGGAAKVVARDVNVYYGDKHAIKRVSVEIADHSVSVRPAAESRRSCAASIA